MIVEVGQLWEFDNLDLYYVVRVVDEQHINLLDIDSTAVHIDPSSKTCNVAQMTGHSFEKLAQEIAKCILLCALCHRMKIMNLSLESTTS